VIIIAHYYLSLIIVRCSSAPRNGKRFFTQQLHFLLLVWHFSTDRWYCIPLPCGCLCTCVLRVELDDGSNVSNRSPPFCSFRSGYFPSRILFHWTASLYTNRPVCVLLFFLFSPAIVLLKKQSERAHRMLLFLLQLLLANRGRRVCSWHWLRRTQRHTIQALIWWNFVSPVLQNRLNELAGSEWVNM
jgi:hypothetical protein